MNNFEQIPVVNNENSEQKRKTLRERLSGADKSFKMMLAGLTVFLSGGGVAQYLENEAHKNDAKFGVAENLTPTEQGIMESVTNAQNKINEANEIKKQMEEKDAR